jgi:tetratricopeptide (TPR) repeat protein
MNQNKYAFVILTAGLMFSTGSLRADDAAPASTPAAVPAAKPAAKPAAGKPSVREQMKAAGALADAGKTDEAIAAYEAIGPLPSNKGESWRQNAEGLAYLKAPKPEPEKAVPFLEKAVAINPDDYYAWRNLGNAYELTNQPKKAVDAYQKATASEKAAKGGDSSQTPADSAKADSAAPAGSSTPTDGADTSK